MDFGPVSGIISSVLSILFVSLFIHFGAKSLTKDKGFTRAIIVAVLGTLFAGIVWAAVGGNLGMVLAIAAWGLVAAFVYRTTWVQGVLIGVAAWLLWLLASWLIAFIF